MKKIIDFLRVEAKKEVDLDLLHSLDGEREGKILALGAALCARKALNIELRKTRRVLLKIEN